MSQINKPNTYFNTVLYTGNNSTNNITGVNFQPDFTWIKDRSTTGESHYFMDIVRGNNKFLHSNSTSSERTGSISSGYNSIAFASDGFDITNSSGLNDETNLTGRNYASWNWLAGGTAVSNTDGTIASSVSANTTAGFSIVSFTNSGSGNRTVGHGLNAKPKMIIQHAINDATNWLVYHENLNSSPENYYLYLNTTNASQTITNIWGAGMTTTTFGINAGVGGTTSYINYCFAEKKGFSKFGSYTGNGSTDGTFVYTGFKPAFVILKNTNNANNWVLLDNKRNTYNVQNTALAPNTSGADDTNTSNYGTDFLSNGMKMRTSGTYTSNSNNATGDTYIYMAFAENPLVGTNNIPATAR